MQRGHHRDACCFADEDFQAYGDGLAEALRKSGGALQADGFMTNPVPRLLTPPRPEAVSPLMSSLGRRDGQSIDRTYRRSGTLWDSRDKSSQVEADHDLLRCQRSIELNPVRAGLVDDPADSRWSSDRANGLGQADALLTPHAGYRALDADEVARQVAYRALFRSELDKEALADIRLALNQGQPLGKGRFLETIEKMTGQRRGVRPRGRPRKEKPAEGDRDTLQPPSHQRRLFHG